MVIVVADILIFWTFQITVIQAAISKQGLFLFPHNYQFSVLSSSNVMMYLTLHGNNEQILFKAVSSRLYVSASFSE